MAKEAFTRSGANASLDDIAREAGVGAGTLYRHFPTRDALIEAVYRTEVEKLAAAQKKFSDSHACLLKHCEPGCCCSSTTLRQSRLSPRAEYVSSGAPRSCMKVPAAQIQGAIDALVKRAIKSGDIRKDLEPFDLLRALIGVSHVASGPDWQQSARRLVDILITGSRPS